MRTRRCVTVKRGERIIFILLRFKAARYAFGYFFMEVVPNICSNCWIITHKEEDAKSFQGRVTWAWNNNAITWCHVRHGTSETGERAVNLSVLVHVQGGSHTSFLLWSLSGDMVACVSTGGSTTEGFIDWPIRVTSIHARNYFLM